MLLTFLFGDDGGSGPAAHGCGAAHALFNGKLRLRAASLGDAGAHPAVVPGPAGDRILTFRAIVSNGSPNRVIGNFGAELADAEGNTVTGRPIEAEWNLAPGAAARTAAEFHVDADFMPSKLMLIDTSEPDVPAFQFDVRVRL